MTVRSRLASLFARFKEYLRSRAHAKANDLVPPAPGPIDPADQIPLRPLHQVSRLGPYDWASNGDDPQIGLLPPFPTGWITLEVRIESHAAGGDRACLFLDAGAGYRQEDCLDLGPVNTEQTLSVFLPDNVVGFRLDPLTRPGNFSIRKFKFRAPTVSETIRAMVERERGRAAALLDAQERDAGNPESGAPSHRMDAYEGWLAVNEWNDRRERLLRARLAQIAPGPLLSVITPVYNPPLIYLDRAIESVVGQIYPNWELCLADDAGPDPDVANALRGWQGRDRRIKTVFREQNGGISAAANTASEMAAGEYLVFLDNDDELTPDALAEVAIYLAENPEADVLYSDEDKIDGNGRRYDPHFKPDWSPELLLSYMYMVHVLVIRRSLFEQVGRLRPAFDGSQDYDLALRTTELAREVGHIPKVLYHWRSLPSSLAASGNAKPASFRAGQEAVQEALERRGISATVFRPDWAVGAAIGLYSHKFSAAGAGARPRVAVLIPTRNKAGVLRTCVESLARTSYPNYEVIIIDNGSDEAETLEYLAGCGRRVLRIPSRDGAFNFAAINNEAVKQIDCDYVLFLNNDTEVVSPDWLSQMVGYMGIEGVGAVGARLVFPDGRVQHAGVVHGQHGVGPRHAFKLAAPNDPGYMGYALTLRNYSAITAACMLTPRDLFLRLNGFDADLFPVAYNDVDYCYRLIAAGYRVVYCPSAELIHHEGQSRGSDDDPASVANFWKRHSAFEDRYKSPHLAYYNPYLADDSKIEVIARTIAPASTPPVRTLMCSANLEMTGPSLSQFELTAGLTDKRVIDPVVFSPIDGPLRTEYERRGIRVEVRPNPLEAAAPTQAGYQFAITNFADWIGTLGVEVVYGGALETVYAIAAAKEVGLPCLWTARESEGWETAFDGDGAHLLRRALECFGYPYKLISTSWGSFYRYLPLCSGHNFVNVNDALDRRRFESRLRETPRTAARAKLGIGEGEIAIVTVGTISERKGQADAINALGALPDETARRVRWFIVANRPGAYTKALQELRAKLDEARRTRVEIVAETLDIMPYYAAADAYCCTSRIQSFSRALLEAMAAGLPIISSGFLGITEQARENHNALFYLAGDAVGLADRVHLLATDQDLRRRLAATSPVVLDTLIDYDTMVATYAAFFREAWLVGKG